jgi:hypothetical protein
MPYIWVDNAMSLATGRETLGYPKAFGKIGFPADGQPASWTLDGYGLNWGPDQRADFHRLLEVTETGGPLQGIDEELESLADIARHSLQALFGDSDFRSVRDDLEFVTSFAHDVLHKELRQVWFKQFRTAENGLGACLQQVVEGRYKVGKSKARLRTREYELEVHEVDSSPIIEELGLQSQQLKAGYEVKMDFEVGDGRVLWDAAGGAAGVP